MTTLTPLPAPTQGVILPIDPPERSTASELIRFRMWRNAALRRVDRLIKQGYEASAIEWLHSSMGNSLNVCFVHRAAMDAYSSAVLDGLLTGRITI